MQNFTYPELDDAQRGAMAERLGQVLQAQAELNAQGGILNFLHANGGQEGDGFYAMRHYPKGDRIDYEHGGQYLYHCHRENVETEEHGHFHCFIRKVGLPGDVAPAELPDKDKYMDCMMTHLVAISVNRVGLPIRLFTVNRWVGHDTWFEAEKMQDFVELYKVRPEKDAEKWGVMDGWIEAMMHAFAPQVKWLQTARDAEMARLIAQQPDNYIYEDKSIEELSSIDISLEAQVQWLMA